MVRSSRLTSPPWVYATVVVLLAHMALLLLLLQQQGIPTDKEAAKYIGSAQDLLMGDLTDTLGRYRAYIGYILFLVPFTTLGLLTGAALVQAALSLLAAFLLRRIVLDLTGRPGAAFFAMACYLLAYPIIKWSLTLYSEGLFIPAGVLLIAWTVHPHAPKAGIALALLWYTSMRPTGILLALPLLLYCSPWTPSIPDRVKWIGLALLAFAILFLPVLPDDQLRGMAEGHVVLTDRAPYPDASGHLTGRSLMAVQQALIREVGPGGWLQITLERAGSFLLPVRPWYSWPHNAIVLPIVLLYPFAALGAWIGRQRPLVRALTTAVLFHMALVMLTYDEWGGRFLGPVLPLIIVLAEVGIGHWSGRRTGRQQSGTKA